MATELAIAIAAAIAACILAAEALGEPASHCLINWATRWLPELMRDRYREEWLAHVGEIDTGLGKLRHAAGCAFGLGSLAEELSKQATSGTQFLSFRKSPPEESRIVYFTSHGEGLGIQKLQLSNVVWLNAQELQTQHTLAMLDQLSGQRKVVILDCCEWADEKRNEPKQTVQ
jgi:hypothetical protein